MTFQCSPGLVPSQQMISVCMANGRWTPDPAELVCIGRPDKISCTSEIHIHVGGNLYKVI